LFVLYPTDLIKVFVGATMYSTQKGECKVKPETFYLIGVFILAAIVIAIIYYRIGKDEQKMI